MKKLTIKRYRELLKMDIRGAAHFHFSFAHFGDLLYGMFGPYDYFLMDDDNKLVKATNESLRRVNWDIFPNCIK